jgi:hypothetical protein
MLFPISAILLYETSELGHNHLEDILYAWNNNIKIYFTGIGLFENVNWLELDFCGDSL